MTNHPHDDDEHPHSTVRGYFRAMIRANSVKPEGGGINNHWLSLAMSVMFSIGQFTLAFRYRDWLMAGVSMFLMISFFVFYEIALYEVRSSWPKRTNRSRGRTAIAMLFVVLAVALNMWLAFV